MDETLVGGLEAGGGRRHLGKKALVVIAAEVRGRAIGRIRMQRVADASADSLLTFVQHAVQPGSVVITDGLQSYRRLPKRGYRHDRRVLLGRGESAEAVLPRVHRVASLLKRWLLGTHQGGVSREHLDYYLDEFTFRFNRRTSRHRGKLFHRLLEQAVAVGPVPYATRRWSRVSVVGRRNATTTGSRDLSKGNTPINRNCRAHIRTDGGGSLYRPVRGGGALHPPHYVVGRPKVGPCLTGLARPLPVAR